MSYLKHNNGKDKGGKRKPANKPANTPEKPEAVRVVITGPDMPTPSMRHSINHVAGLADIEASLDWIARGLSRLTSDEHAIQLSTGFGTNPLKVTLAPDEHDDMIERFVTAVERIADSVARLAGLSRPRLEMWHEQDDYEPRYKDIAVDGGAPGPKEHDTNALKTGVGGTSNL